jgi:hypothetical protein
MKRILFPNNQLLQLFYLIALTLLGVGCDRAGLSDADEGGSITPTAMELILPLHILNELGDDTRAESRSTSAASAAELEIKSLHFFLFDNTGVCKIHALLDSSTGFEAIEGNKTATPTIRLKLTDLVSIAADDDVVFILNQPALSTDYMRFTKADIDTEFPLKNSTGFHPSPVADDLGVAGIPMYGEVKGVVFGSAASGRIDIMRAVAKLQVKLDPAVVGDAAAGTNVGDRVHFTADKVTYQLYQQAISGSILTPTAPNTISYSTDNSAPLSTVDGGDINRAVFMTNSLDPAASTKGVCYLYEFPYSTNLISPKDDIADAVIAADTYHVGHLAVLLKVAQDAPDTYLYYNLSLYDKDENRYLDVVRNHNYQLIIKSVQDGAGYATATEALLSPTSNVEFDILDNTTGAITVSNGAYGISVGTQHYADSTVYLNQAEDFSEFVLTDEVRYILSPTLSALPAGLENKITVKPTPTDDRVTISPAHLTDQTERLILRVPKDYIGRIDFSVQLGELLYDTSKDLETKPDGTVFQPLIIGDWRDIDDGSGELGASLTFPQLVIMDHSTFPHYSYTSDSVKFDGSVNRVNIFLPAVGGTWSDAITEATFNDLFKSSPKPSWLTGATFDSDAALTSGHFTFTYAQNSSEELYKIKIQSRGITRMMTLTPVNGNLIIGSHTQSFTHQPMIYHEGDVFSYPVFTGGGSTKWKVVKHTGFAALLSGVHTPAVNALEESGKSIHFDIPANTNLTARSATVTLARNEEGQEGYKTITLIQEGEPTFELSQPLEANYYDAEPISFKITIGDASERDKYSWIATRKYKEEDVENLNPGIGDLGNKVLSLSSTAIGSPRGAYTMGGHNDILTITPPERAWSDRHSLGNISIRLVRRATSRAISTHAKSVDFKTSTPDLIFDENNPDNILHDEIYHEAEKTYVHRIRTGSAIIGWSGVYTPESMGYSPFTVSTRSGGNDSEINIHLPKNPNPSPRSGRVLVSRVESGYNRSRTINFSQEGKPNFSTSLRANYYNGDPIINQSVTIGNSSERVKYGWRLELIFDDPTTPNNGTFLSLSSDGNNEGNNTSIATGHHTNRLKINAPVRAWSPKEITGHIQMNLVRKDPKMLLETDAHKKTFTLSTPEIRINGSAESLDYFVYHEGAMLPAYRIQT